MFQLTVVESYPSLWLYYKAWSLVSSRLTAEVWKSQHTPVAEARGVASSSVYTALQCTGSCSDSSMRSQAAFCSLSCVFTWYKLVELFDLNGTSSAPWSVIMGLQCDWTRNSWTPKCLLHVIYVMNYTSQNTVQGFTSLYNELISTIFCVMHYSCWPR